MRKTLQAVAVLVAVVAAGIWLATGAHRGWTKTEVERITVDEITGIEGRSYEKQFVAGVEFLVAGLLAAGGLAVISLFFRQLTKNKLNPNTES